MFWKKKLILRKLTKSEKKYKIKNIKLSLNRIKLWSMHFSKNWPQVKKIPARNFKLVFIFVYIKGILKSKISIFCSILSKKTFIVKQLWCQIKPKNVNLSRVF